MGRTCRQWPMFERVLSHARLIDAMLQHAPEAGKACASSQGTAWYQARTECLVCPEARRCRIGSKPPTRSLRRPSSVAARSSFAVACVRPTPRADTKHPSS